MHGHGSRPHQQEDRQHRPSGTEPGALQSAPPGPDQYGQDQQDKKQDHSAATGSASPNPSRPTDCISERSS
ncbi:MAG: hypothetical protein JWM33_2666 [Caulobacteraceae bacterium]|nr:hypothetical protein [Caulobacteraceae bacterium]